MNSLEALLSDTRQAISLRRPELANKEDEVLGGENCDPKIEQPCWHDKVWHCQRESQNISLGHFDKEQEFWGRAIGRDVRDVMPSGKFAGLWEDINQMKSR
jgi:hypothetical protein